MRVSSSFFFLPHGNAVMSMFTSLSYGTMSLCHYVASVNPDLIQPKYRGLGPN